jgi:hypothetical protein
LPAHEKLLVAADGVQDELRVGLCQGEMGSRVSIDWALQAARLARAGVLWHPAGARRRRWILHRQAVPLTSGMMTLGYRSL